MAHAFADYLTGEEESLKITPVAVTAPGRSNEASNTLDQEYL
jgi:hypothetical protein